MNNINVKPINVQEKPIRGERMNISNVKPTKVQKKPNSAILEGSEKAASISFLSCLKTKTTLGKPLSYQDRQTGKQLIYKMMDKGWLTDEDRKWAVEKLEMSI